MLASGAYTWEIKGRFVCGVIWVCICTRVCYKNSLVWAGKVRRGGPIARTDGSGTNMDKSCFREPEAVALGEFECAICTVICVDPMCLPCEHIFCRHDAESVGGGCAIQRGDQQMPARPEKCAAIGDQGCRVGYMFDEFHAHHGIKRSWTACRRCSCRM